MTFSSKKIRVMIQLFEGEFYPGVSAINITDLPTEVNIEQVQLPSGGSAVVKIYGVSKRYMDAITTVQWITGTIQKKAIAIYANEGDGEHLIYSGAITNAIPCYDSAPDVYIRINSCAGAFWDTMGEVPPYSHKGTIPVHLAIEEMCGQYGVLCKNFGVLKTCVNPRFDQKGLKKRLNAAATQFGIDISIGDGISQGVNLYEKGKNQTKTWNFTKENYVGYPTFNDCGILIQLDKLYYDLDLKDYFDIKGSEVSVAKGSWKVQKISYNISTKLGGNWLMGIVGTRYGVLDG